MPEIPAIDTTWFCLQMRGLKQQAT